MPRPVDRRRTLPDRAGGYQANRAIERPHFAALDGVRAVAAFAVLCTHVGFASGRSVGGAPFAGLLSRLDFGVTLFFLLSGFVIYDRSPSPC